VTAMDAARRASEAVWRRVIRSPVTVAHHVGAVGGDTVRDAGSDDQDERFLAATRSSCAVLRGRRPTTYRASSGLTAATLAR
jgi:hypothetical protein